MIFKRKKTVLPPYSLREATRRNAHGYIGFSGSTGEAIETVIKELSAALEILDNTKPNQLGKYIPSEDKEKQFDRHFNIGLGWALALAETHKDYTEEW